MFAEREEQQALYFPHTSVHSEKTLIIKLIMIIIIIIILNKSQELTVLHGRQKLTSAKN